MAYSLTARSLVYFILLLGAVLNSSVALASDPRRSVLARAHHRHARALASQIEQSTPRNPVVDVAKPAISNSEALPVPVKKRQLARRCVRRPSNSTAVPAAPSSSDAATPTTLVAPPDDTPAPSPAAASPSPPPSPASSHSSQLAQAPTSTKASTPVIQSPSLPSIALPSPPPLPAGPSFLTGQQTGQGTFYEVGGAAVACGEEFTDNDFIAAVSHLLFDAFPGATGNPNNNPVCGRTVTAHWQGGSTTVKIVDRCTGCALTDLDFSPAAFGQLTNGGFSIGRISGMTWTWD